MDLIEINHTIGCLSAELSLYECNICEVSLTTLRKLSSFLRERHLDFERDIRAGIRDKATEFYTEELYASLTSYSDWWRPVIEDLVPKFIVPGREKDPEADNDPKGYNATFGKPGEKYRSIRYDITENPEYPHLTEEIIFNRLKTIISSMDFEGADISRLLSLAFKHGLLSRPPYRKSIIRELGMKSSEQSLTELIANRSDEISYSKRLERMEEELLRK